MANKDDQGKKHGQVIPSEFELAVLNAIESLPEQVQKVYTLHRKDGFTYQEIASIMDIIPESVELHMSEALKTLTQHLQHFSKTKN